MEVSFRLHTMTALASLWTLRRKASIFAIAPAPMPGLPARSTTATVTEISVAVGLQALQQRVRAATICFMGLSD